MMNGGPSGFNNAPVTRAFVIASALFTVVFGIRGRSNKLGLSYQDIFQNLQLWKLLTSLFAFSSTPELMFGLYLLYYFRVFERQIGSSKYSVFILFSVITSLLLEVAALAILKDPSVNLITSGPYGLIFSSFVQFYFDIPVSSRVRFFGFRFSDKSFIYVAGLQQLLFSSWKRSILPGVCGILAGLLYRLNIFYVRRIKYPDFVAAFFSWFSLPSSLSTSSAAATRNVLGNSPTYVGRQAERNYPAPSASVEPQEDSISTLVSMGFDRNDARQALVQAKNDVNIATNILLEAQSH
ncbi:Rhomboid-like protein [Drosera capensis]